MTEVPIDKAVELFGVPPPVKAAVRSGTSNVRVPFNDVHCALVLLRMDLELRRDATGRRR